MKEGANNWSNKANNGKNVVIIGRRCLTRQIIGKMLPTWKKA